MKYILFFWVSVLSAQEPFSLADLNYYYDTRDQVDFNVNLLYINGKFQHVTLINLTSSEGRFDMNHYYSEHHFRWKILPNHPLFLSTLLTSASGDNNDNLKFGMVCELSQTSGLKSAMKKMNLFALIAVHVVETAKHHTPVWMPQVEYVYRFDFTKEVYLSGFADQDLGDTFHSTWVTEHQVGYLICANVYAVAEFRYNGYIPESTGLGVGVQYVINF